VDGGGAPLAERVGMKAAGFALSNGGRLERAEKFARIAQRPFERDGKLHNLPGMLAGWTKYRDMPAIPKESFREWWAKREKHNATGKKLA
jgi:L-lactate dehydrogenase complex protein LldF